MSLPNHWLIPKKPYESYEVYQRATGENAVEVARGLDPKDVLKLVQRSGLRGRGGAGFPTGIKWSSIMNHSCETRFVVCNAAEGEPGTFKDRWLIRHNPYAILEGMLIAAYVVGASRLFIGSKASFDHEIRRLREAVSEMREQGLLEGLDFTIVEGPEEYLFGEEKALLEVIEGSEPLPREAHYPPYERGLFASTTAPNPALVNNAETFARVPGIVRFGPESFREIGMHNTPGTLLFTVCGDVVRPGVYERESGITLRELLYDVAGGPGEGREFKVVLPGVASQSILPKQFDTPLGFDTMKHINSGLGSAGFIVYDDQTSIPRLAQAVARFLYVESCNQCSACKHGLGMASASLDELADPKLASPDDYQAALYGARSAPQGNRCYLPVQGSLVISSLMESFEAEFTERWEHPDRDTKPVILPKLTDFDPKTKTFAFDDRQALKRPDWTYAEEPPRTVVRPHDADRAPVVVRLASELAEPLRERAATSGQSLDDVVNSLVRQWLEH